MIHMFRRRKRTQAEIRSDQAPATYPLPVQSATELHLCCICGAQLGTDLEDEIDGEGPGRDICGDCNRTKNFEVERGF